MSDVAVAEVPSAPVEQVKSPKAKKKKASKKSTHPPTAEMVTAAIKDLKEHNGSSLQAIKKYISNTYFIDAEKISFHIRKYIKSAVDAQVLVQTKGKGASGSFKLAITPGGERKRSKTQRTVHKPTAQSGTAAVPKKNVLRSKKTKKLPTTPKVPKPKKGVKSKTPSVKPLKPKATKKSKKAAPKKK